jgi:tRNA threonylcarbamoyladenosine biosynthesis protein TsaB
VIAMLTLALDAATYDGSVAVIDGDRVLTSREVMMRGEREERLMPGVAEALHDAGVGATDLTRVVCGAGPGSFTSLRIAASIAKGIAAARGVPLFAASSLLLLVAAASCCERGGRYLAVLDAMRGDVHVAGFEVAAPDIIVELSPATLVSREALPQLARRFGARLIGPAEELAASPHARGVARLGALLERGHPVNLASWEPQYGRLAEAQVLWEHAHGRPLPRA